MPAHVNPDYRLIWASTYLELLDIFTWYLLRIMLLRLWINVIKVLCEVVSASVDNPVFTPDYPDYPDYPQF